VIASGIKGGRAVSESSHDEAALCISGIFQLLEEVRNHPNVVRSYATCPIRPTRPTRPTCLTALPALPALPAVPPPYLTPLPGRERGPGAVFDQSDNFTGSSGLPV
jgi:hypothetical protein